MSIDEFKPPAIDAPSEGIGFGDNLDSGDNTGNVSRIRESRQDIRKRNGGATDALLDKAADADRATKSSGDSRDASTFDSDAAAAAAAKKSATSTKAPKDASHKTKPASTKAKPSTVSEEDLVTDIGALALDELNYTAAVGSQQNNVHIRVLQRSGRKVLTRIENIPGKYSMRKLERELKRELQCGGSLLKDADGRPILIQLNGDHRQSSATWLRENLDIDPETIVIHGF